MDISTLGGIALVVLGIYLAIKVAGLVAKLAFVALIAFGLYLWLVA